MVLVYDEGAQEFPNSKIPYIQLNQIKQIIEFLKPNNILEVGSFEGLSANNLVALALENTSEIVHITCIDTWEGGQEHQQGDIDFKAIEERFDNNMENLIKGSKGQAQLLKLKNSSINALSSLLVNSDNLYDLIYIDAGHRASEVLLDLVLSWHLLSRSGVMIIDDYLWRNLPILNFLDCPKFGIDSFINCHLEQINILPNTPLQQIYIQKK